MSFQYVMRQLDYQMEWELEVTFVPYLEIHNT